jgi:hypothetical protein
VLTGNQPPADGRLYFNMFNNLDKWIAVTSCIRLHAMT